MQSAASWVKNVGVRLSCDFPTDSCKFLTETVAQNFNFDPKFPKSGDCQPQILHFCKNIIRQTKI